MLFRSAGLIAPPAERSESVLLGEDLEPQIPGPVSYTHLTPLWATTSFMTPYWVDQISMGLCSTQQMCIRDRNLLFFNLPF